MQTLVYSHVRYFALSSRCAFINTLYITNIECVTRKLLCLYGPEKTGENRVGVVSEARSKTEITQIELNIILFRTRNLRDWDTINGITCVFFLPQTSIRTDGQIISAS